MNNQTALLRQALDALVEIKSIVDTLLPGPPLGHEGSPEMMAINAIDAIRAELAKPQAEPVAINYTPLFDFAESNFVSYNQLCKAVHESLLVSGKRFAFSETPQAQPAPEPAVTNDMVSRFLAWKLPRDFAPDAGITFRAASLEGFDLSLHWPTGTNLFHAGQARAMLEHVLGTAQPQAQPAVREPTPTSGWIWQHRKGGEYTLIGVGKIQCDVPPNDMAEVVLYRAEIDGKLWVRPEAEFNERFKRLRPLAQPAVPPDMVLVPVEYFAAAPSAVPEWIRRQAAQRGAEIVQPVPLTDEQIAGEASTVWEDYEDDIDRRTEFARAIISKFCEVNGIGETKP